MKTDTLFIQVPEDLRYPPRYWSPELCYHMSHLKEEGVDLSIIDWALNRVNYNVVVNELEKYQYDELILWGGIETYRYIDQLREHIRDFKVGGMTKDAARIVDVDPLKDITQTFERWLPDPFHGFFSRSYFQHQLAYTADTLMWERRVPMRFRYKRHLRDRDAALLLRDTKVQWWFDSVDWMDDVTTDKEWTQKLLEYCGEFKTGFQYIARADHNKIDPKLLNLLRETGCRVIDYGDIMVSKMREPETFIRLQGAFNETQKLHMYPSCGFVIDKGTTEEACRETTKFMLSVKGSHRPKLHHPYGWAKSPEDVLAMNRDLWNPTEETWITVYGWQLAMENGNLDAF